MLAVAVVATVLGVFGAASAAGAAAPTISGFSPSSGSVGTSVTITGTGFTGATAVAFNGTSTSFTISRSTRIKAIVPSGARTGPITVTTPSGTATRSGFTVTGSAPTIGSFSPSSGSVGTSVTITGTGFAGATAVAFNGSSASFSVNSSTRISATVPSGAGTGPITVNGPGGSATGVGSFTVTPAARLAYRYMTNSGSDPATVAANGFNVLDVTSQALADLLPAGTRGLVWVGDYDNTSCSWEVSDAALRSELTAEPGDAKVAGYFFSDEPDPHACPNAPAQHKARSGLIHLLDPGKPTVLLADSNSGQASLDQMPLWKGAADYVALDPYPCYQHKPCNYAWIDSIINAADQAGLSYWGVAQAFSDSTWRWPTNAELTHMLSQWAASRESGYMTFAWTWAGNNLSSQPGLLDALQQFNGSIS